MRGYRRNPMKADRHLLIILPLLFFLFSGCAAVNPLVSHYENNFSGFRSSTKDMRKSQSLTMQFPASFDEVWENALSILTQEAIIIDVSRTSGTISYIIIDGVYFGDVFPENTFYYWDFPFTVSVERGKGVTSVTVCPLTGLYKENDTKKKWWRNIHAGFHQQGEEFLLRLSAQLTVQERWQWLKNEGAP